MRPIQRLLAVVLLAALAPQARALSYVMMRDDALVDQAARVLRVEVVALEPGAAPASETSYRVAALADVAGLEARGIERLILPGADPAAAFGQRVHGVPRLAAGERLLLFAVARDDGALLPLQLTLGLFIEYAVDGTRYYTRALDVDGDLGDGAHAIYHLPRVAQRFERWVAARRVGLKLPVDYLSTHPKALAQAKFTQIRFANNLPVRWQSFDGGGSVGWVALAGGQAGMATDEFLQLQQALAAWTNDPGSRISLVYGGTIAAPDTHCDDVISDGNAVLWNDPLNTIGGSFSCSSGGTLATGGPCGAGTHLASGQSYNTAFEGRVTVQDGAGCFFDGNNGANGAEVLTHELGHTLGLGHSCGDGSSPSCGSSPVLNAATMRAQAHGDGRGAALGQDDRDAVAFIYPQPGGPPPNQAPSINAPGSYSGSEDTPLTLGNIVFADPDAGASAVVATFTVATGAVNAGAFGGVTVGGTGTARTLTGSIANLNQLIAGGLLSYLPAANANGSVTLGITINDQGNTGSGGPLSTSRSSGITIAAVNDAPTLAAPASYPGTEDTPRALNGIALGDVDAGSGNLTLTLGAASGTLSAVAAGGVAVAGSGTGTLVLSGTLANLNAFVGGASANVTYAPVANANGSVALTLAVTDNGHSGSGGALTAQAASSIVLAAVNDAPTLSVPASVNADAAGTIDLAPAVLVDVDAGAGTVRLTLRAGQGSLVANSGGGVTVTGSGSGVLVLGGTLAALDAFLAGQVRLVAGPGPASVPLELTLSDEGMTGAGGALSASATTSVQTGIEIHASGFE